MYAGGKMLYSCFSELIDTGVSEDLLQAMTHTIKNTHGVIAVHQLRTRSLAGDIFVDVHIQVSPRISVSEGHYISEHVHLALVNTIEHVRDVTVHIDPEDDEASHPCANLPDRNTLLNALKKTWGDLEAPTNILFHYHDGYIDIDLYFNTPPTPENAAIYRTIPVFSPRCINRISLYTAL